ncbi:hypothetical protein EQP59_10385 [Ornithobacterium rhinotracheale]|uniref:Uncharacterized protein n=1 Tax=Ornithobacterium rhinotracheale TaxID=28251 RepID=A0A3R5YXA3_ORNRH|nr:DUF6427 family protein [Ornithobacterium rhinotracheale]QAR31716.1 hypothetical protein EQP59_10385 [Ornithobacterium rhinotracheale]
MLSKILKLNQTFVSFLLYGIAIALILLQFHANLHTDFEWGAAGLFAVVMAALVGYSQWISFFNRTHYFEFFSLIAFALLVPNFSSFSFFAGFLFLMIILLQLLDEFDLGEKLLSPFDIGFFMAIACFLHPPFWIFCGFLLLHYLLLGRVMLRGLALCFLGILSFLLLIIELSILFNFSDLAPYLWNYFIPQISFHFNAKYLWLSPILALIVFGLNDYIQHINRHTAEKKMVFFNAIMFIPFAILYTILYSNEAEYAILFYIIPMALILSNYCLYASTKYKEITLLVFILSILLYKYAHLIKLPGILNDISL